MKRHAASAADIQCCVLHCGRRRRRRSPCRAVPPLAVFLNAEGPNCSGRRAWNYVMKCDSYLVFLCLFVFRGDTRAPRHIYMRQKWILFRETDISFFHYYYFACLMLLTLSLTSTCVLETRLRFYALKKSVNRSTWIWEEKVFPHSRNFRV